MGIQMALAKEENKMWVDFPQAYWSIDEVRIDSKQGLVVFEFRAYPNRESKIHHLAPLTSNRNWGGSEGIAVNSILYEWVGAFPITDLFPEGVPVSEADQKDVLYEHVKHYLELTDYEDVLED